jgi:hypothetical protein
LVVGIRGLAWESVFDLPDRRRPILKFEPSLGGFGLTLLIATASAPAWHSQATGPDRFLRFRD